MEDDQENRDSGPALPHQTVTPADDDSQSDFDDFEEARILERFKQKHDARVPALTPDQRSVAFRPGIMINKRFKVLKQLGFGGMGAVYLVKDTHLRERRALKVMLPRLLSNPQAQRRFLIETKVTQRLSHENIVRVHDLGVDFDSGIQFFTMAFVRGETLYSYLKKQDGMLPLEEVLDIGRQLCDALEYAHRTTIHRDLKPQNIMRGDDGHITILDFGLAKLLDQSNPALSRMGVGTANYQAPEQTANPLNIDRRADLYAVGVILYQLLTGKLPISRYTPASRLVRGVPRRMDAIIRRCLKQRSERYREAAELRADLDRVNLSGLRRFLSGFRRAPS